MHCRRCNFSASVSVALRTVRGHVASSVTSAVRAHNSHASRCLASEATIFICEFSVSDRRLRTRPADSLRGALNHPVFGFGQLVRSSASPASGPPNKSFKPTPCRGVGHVLYATLAHVRRPATGRLNSGVRRQKAFGSCAVSSATYQLRSALLFGWFLGASLLRSSPLCALTHRMRCVGRLRTRRSSSLGSQRLSRGFGHGRLRVRKARSSVRASVFGKFAGVSVSSASFPPNKSFKPTPHRGVNSVLYATLHAVATPPWGGLTPALGGRKAFCNCVARKPDFLASVSAALRSGCRLVASSVMCVWRAHRSHAWRWPASETVICIVRLSAADAIASVAPG